MVKRVKVLLTVAALVLVVFQFPASGTAEGSPHYPDLITKAPSSVRLSAGKGGGTVRRLFFGNTIGNIGDGPLELRAENNATTGTTNAIQEIRSSNAQYLCGTQPKPNDPCYTVLQEQQVSTFEYHPTHNHWHTADVARFEVRQGSPTGTVVGGNSIKVGFCLLDLYNLEENAPTSEKTFWDCYTSYQGVSVGWVDQYHQSTDGQQVDLTGIPDATDYYLVSTTDPTGVFLEQDKTNNTAWVKFTLSSESNGNRKVTITDHSPCESPGLCGERSTNR